MITTAQTPSGWTCPGCQGMNENARLAFNKKILNGGTL